MLKKIKEDFMSSKTATGTSIEGINKEISEMKAKIDSQPVAVQAEAIPNPALKVDLKSIEDKLSSLDKAMKEAQQYISKASTIEDQPMASNSELKLIQQELKEFKDFFKTFEERLNTENEQIKD